MLFSCGTNKKNIKLPYSHSHFFCYISIALYIVEYSANMDGKNSCVKETKCLVGDCCLSEHSKRAAYLQATHEYSMHLMRRVTTEKHLPFSTDLFFPAMFLQTKGVFNSTKAQKRGSACITVRWATCNMFKVSVLECFRSLHCPAT